MPTPLSTILPVSAATPVADAAAPGLVLEAGTVVEARVLSVMADNLVRIAIANLALDVMSEVKLSPGQNLQLAVSQNEAGMRLAIVNPAGGADADQITLATGAAAAIDSPPLAPSSNASGRLLTPLEQIALAVASAEAATRQGSQAPLFANLASVVGGSGLPPALKQAAMDVLAQQTPLDPQLGGGEIETAFQKSGLFLEASLASGAAPSAGTVPDLKAALLVLRQTLAVTTGALEPLRPLQAAAPGTAPGAAPTSPPQAVASLEQAVAALRSASQGPSPSPDGQQSSPAPRDASVLAAAPAETTGGGPSGTVPRNVAAGAALGLLQQAMQEAPGLTARRLPGPDIHNADTAARAIVTPPPFRGALPSPQAIAQASLAPDAPLAATLHRLLDDTDAAIARQTLLQVASLPDRVDAPAHRIDPTLPQWNFEIPFATPRGTAMAQFEISRDGGGQESDSARRAWRARFALNVEPAGPVHALVALIGDKTSVRMWAERPATAAQLRAGLGELSQALTKAELNPGDIVVRDGLPPQPAPVKAGHFLDRAT